MTGNYELCIHINLLHVYITFLGSYMIELILLDKVRDRTKQRLVYKYLSPHLPPLNTFAWENTHSNIILLNELKNFMQPIALKSKIDRCNFLNSYRSREMKTLSLSQKQILACLTRLVRPLICRLVEKRSSICLKTRIEITTDHPNRGNIRASFVLKLGKCLTWPLQLEGKLSNAFQLWVVGNCKDD